MRTIFGKGIIGTPIEDFIKAYKQITVDNDVPDLILRESRLIPIGKKDDELAITSVFLSAVKYVKEFRNELFSKIGFIKSGTIYCFSEVSFPSIFQEDSLKKQARFDGLLLSVSSSGVIKNAMLFEMKSGSEKINEEQLTLYINMAKDLRIEYFVTISNEFVTTTKDSPLPNIQKYAGKKKVKLFHFSWSAIQALSRKLGKVKEHGIEDDDQQLLMKEILYYFEGCGAIKTFDKMDSCWKDLMKELGSGNAVISSDTKNQISIIVRDWIQQENDLAIKLGDRLSEKELVDVACGKKTNQTMEERIRCDETLLKDERILQSIYRIPNAVSPLIITMDSSRKAITQSFDIDLPEGETCKKQLALIRNDLKKAQKNNQGKFDSLGRNTTLIIKTKGKNDDLRFNIIEFLDPSKVTIEKSVEFKSASILLEIDMGADFLSPIKVIALEEEAAFGFYETIMQFFKKYVKPAPQIPQGEENAEIEKI